MLRTGSEVKRQEAALAAGATCFALQPLVFSAGGSYTRLSVALGGGRCLRCSLPSPLPKPQRAAAEVKSLVCCHLLLKGAQRRAGVGAGRGTLQPADPQKARSALTKELRLRGGSVANREQQ